MQPSVASRPPWWLWPTILSLDAPVVIVLWQGLIARSASAAIGTPERLVLGASIWLAYSADRWIEGWRLSPGSVRTHRHLFYQRRRWPLLAAWIAVLALDVTESFRGLSPRELGAGGLLLLAVAAYLLSHQLLHRRNRWRAPKEACIALLLSAGAALFPASRPGADLRGMALPLLLLVLLCFSNCALISVWEDDVDRSHGQTSLALQFGGAAALSRILPWAILVLSLAFWAAGGPHARPACACAAASSVLLGAVDLGEKRVGRVAARVMADVALMTPAVLFFLESP